VPSLRRGTADHERPSQRRGRSPPARTAVTGQPGPGLGHAEPEDVGGGGRDRTGRLRVAVADDGLSASARPAKRRLSGYGPGSGDGGGRLAWHGAAADTRGGSARGEGLRPERRSRETFGPKS